MKAAVNSAVQDLAFPPHCVDGISEELINSDPGKCWRQAPLCDQQTGDSKDSEGVTNRKWRNENTAETEQRTGCLKMNEMKHTKLYIKTHWVGVTVKGMGTVLSF